jgi:hypothetical protein
MHLGILKWGYAPYKQGCALRLSRSKKVVMRL